MKVPRIEDLLKGQELVLTEATPNMEYIEEGENSLKKAIVDQNLKKAMGREELKELLEKKKKKEEKVKGKKAKEEEEPEEEEEDDIDEAAAYIKKEGAYSSNPKIRSRAVAHNIGRHAAFIQAKSKPESTGKEFAEHLKKKGKAFRKYSPDKDIDMDTIKNINTYLGKHLKSKHVIGKWKDEAAKHPHLIAFVKGHREGYIKHGGDAEGHKSILASAIGRGHPEPDEFKSEKHAYKMGHQDGRNDAINDFGKHGEYKDIDELRLKSLRNKSRKTLPPVSYDQIEDKLIDNCNKLFKDLRRK